MGHLSIKIFKVGVNLFLKIILIISLHVLLMFSGDSFLISSYQNIKVNLSKEQQRSKFYFVPKNINYIIHFSDATSGIWFKPIELKNNQLIIYNVDLQSVNIVKDDLKKSEVYKISRIDKRNILKKIMPVKIITIKLYIFHHLWKIILLILLFLIFSLGIDNIFLRMKKINFILISLYILYLIDVSLLGFFN